MQRSPEAGSGAERDEPFHRLAAAIDQFRGLFFILIAVLFLICFNGQWKIGRDSALYRGLARNLANGNGYTFGEFAPQAVYPGYPLLLAGIEKVFGPGPLAPLVVMYGLAALVLVFTYKLIALRYPRWMAVCIVCGVGFNAWFLELSHELLTDVPFLLGVMLALYGWERLRLSVGAEMPGMDEPGAAKREAMAPALAYLVVGLVIAATMRPTFWILAIAWVATCLWGLITGPRKFYAVCLGIIAVVALAILLVDPRTEGFEPLGGAYEADAVRMLGQAARNVPAATMKMLGKDLPALYFGGRFVPGLTHAISVLLIGASVVLLWRRHRLWALLVPATIGVTLIMSTVPRYYLMVLPILLLAWLLMLVEVARRLPPRWAITVLFCGLAMVVAPNIVRCVRVVANQWVRNPGGMTKWGEMVELAHAIKQSTPPDAKIIGPAAPILSYFSERQVYMTKELIPLNKKPAHYPQHIKSLGIEYAVFGPGLYDKGEGLIEQLMERGVIVPGRRVSRHEGMMLATIEVVVPERDWRKSPRVRISDAETIVTRPKPTPEEYQRRAAAERRELAEKAEARRRLEVREQRKRLQRRRNRQTREPPASAPTTWPTTAPATRPVPVTRAGAQKLPDPRQTVFFAALAQDSCVGRSQLHTIRPSRSIRRSAR